MACNSGNQTLDPFQNILDSVNKSISTLEKQASEISPDISSFNNIGSLFPIENISPTSAVNNALSKMTDEAFCASVTDIAPIDDLVDDCLNEALSGVKKYLSNILGNIEDGIDYIADLVSLPEFGLMKSFQNIWKLSNNIKGLVGGIDQKINCVALSSQAEEYLSQITDLQDRMDTVTTTLKLADDGSFDPDKLMENFDPSLKANIELYKSKSDELQYQITNNISSMVDLSTNINPPRRF